MTSGSVVVGRPGSRTQLLRCLCPGMEFELVYSRAVARDGEIVSQVVYGPLRRRVNKVQTNAVNFTGPGYEGRLGYDGREYTPERPVWLRWTKDDRFEFTDGFWALVKESETARGERVSLRLEFRYR